MDTASKTRSWVKIALVVSLLLNLAFVGMIGSIVTRAGPDGSALRAAFSALPREDRRGLRRQTRDIWQTTRLARYNPSAGQDMIAALRADEFDQDAFARAVAQTQENLVRVGERMQATLIEHVTKMDHAERIAYADALEERLRRRQTRDRAARP